MVEQRIHVDGKPVTSLAWVLAPDYRAVTPVITPGSDEWRITVDSKVMTAICTHTSGFVAVLTVQHLSYVV